jgi:hypothetical protein
MKLGCLRNTTADSSIILYPSHPLTNLNMHMLAQFTIPRNPE